jgi:hypothetical protein
MKISHAEAKKLGLDHIWKPRKGPPKTRKSNDPFLAMCEAHGLPPPVPEYEFCPGRKWRFDWLFEGWLALEIEGGVFTQQAHGSISGIKRDMEKYNEAQILGYSVLRVLPEDIDTGAAFALVKRALEQS